VGLYALPSIISYAYKVMKASDRRTIELLTTDERKTTFACYVKGQRSQKISRYVKIVFLITISLTYLACSKDEYKHRTKSDVD
jgi:hypothetical protein